VCGRSIESSLDWHNSLLVVQAGGIRSPKGSAEFLG
jgi:hypothetical protein